MVLLAQSSDCSTRGSVVEKQSCPDGISLKISDVSEIAGFPINVDQWGSQTREPKNGIRRITQASKMRGNTEEGRKTGANFRLLKIKWEMEFKLSF